MRRACFEKSGGISKTVFQPQIDHIIIIELAQAGILGAVEKHKTGGDLPVVADFVFGEYLRGLHSYLCGRPIRRQGCQNTYHEIHLFSENDKRNFKELSQSY